MPTVLETPRRLGFRACRPYDAACGRATLDVVATLLTAAGRGCSGLGRLGPGAGSHRPRPSTTGTPLADVGHHALVVARAPFCDAVDPAAVAAPWARSRPTARRTGAGSASSSATTSPTSCTSSAAAGPRATPWPRRGCSSRPSPAARAPTWCARLPRRAGTRLRRAVDPCRTQAGRGPTYTLPRPVRRRLADLPLTGRRARPGGDARPRVRWCAAVATGAASGLGRRRDGDLGQSWPRWRRCPRPRPRRRRRPPRSGRPVVELALRAEPITQANASSPPRRR
jgi:hypothetical protein